MGELDIKRSSQLSRSQVHFPLTHSLLFSLAHSSCRKDVGDERFLEGSLLGLLEGSQSIIGFSILCVVLNYTLKILLV